VSLLSLIVAVVAFELRPLQPCFSSVISSSPSSFVIVASLKAQIFKLVVHLPAFPICKFKSEDPFPGWEPPSTLRQRIITPLAFTIILSPIADN
ncbi:hypothetical protein L195_g059561, partial [Trifolium pratense]